MITAIKLKKKQEGLLVIQDISLAIPAGSLACIVGPSGCGKSTLLKMIAKIDTPDSGILKIQACVAAFMFQEDRLIPWSSTLENISLVGKDPSRARKLLESVGLKGFESAFPHELSGGMRRRCAFARALNFEAPLLLLDEPFGSLDFGLRQEMTQLLKTYHSQYKKTTILVTHDVDEAMELADIIIVLSKRPTVVLETIQICRSSKWDRKTTKERIIKRLREE